MFEQPSEYYYPCESCGANLGFAPGEHALTCPYCGHRQEIGHQGAGQDPAGQPGAASAGPPADGPSAIPRVGEALQWDAAHKAPHLREIPLDEGLRLDAGSDLAVTVRQVACPNCGARIEVDSDRHATRCPFCATPVVTDTGTARLIKPQAVLPFAVTEEAAREALGRWMKGLWFAPSGLARYARKGRRMDGIYTPFWTFDADTRTSYRGLRGDHYVETVWVTRMVDGRRQRVPEQVVRTRWTPAAGEVARAFDDVLVPASAALPPGFTQALAPWDLAQLADYRPAYLAGFESESYTLPLNAGHDSARARMASVIAADVRRDIGGDVQQIKAMRTEHTHETFKHVLLPVWSAAYRYGQRSYRVVINGQSGTVHGERPWSAWKIAGAVLLALILAAAAFLLLSEYDGDGAIRFGADDAPCAAAACNPVAGNPPRVWG